jgi:hypothetical protein
MPIDKLTPKYLSSDSDNKLAAKNVMLDAINLYIGGDDSDSSLNGGDGVLKNVKGNLEVLGSDNLPAGAVVLGKIEDTKTKLLYLFVWAPSGDKHSVWVYDPLGRLPGAVVNSLRPVYRSAQFNFPQDGFVKADIVYSSSREAATREQFDSLGSDFEKDAIIYFTDGVNEPRQINAYRALVSDGSNINGATLENPFPETDFITACLKAPLSPVTFKFKHDEARSISNFKLSGGFQFAYQHVYKNGGESAISSYSDVAFIPSVLNQGAATYRNHDYYSRCDLTLPVPGPEVSVLRLLARQGITGSFLVVDEIENEDFNEVYEFYNDRILTGVSTDEVNKQFDSLPRKAKAQAVSNNRLMYGNYEDGYENVKASCRVSLNHLDRPEDFQDYDIDVKPFLGYSDDSEQGFSAVNARSSGIYVNTSSLPDSMISGATVNFDFKINPDSNWHIHTSFGYSQSRRVGVTEPTETGTTYDGVNESFTTTSPQNAAGTVNNLGGVFSTIQNAQIPSSTNYGAFGELGNFTELVYAENHVKAAPGALGASFSFKWKVAEYQNNGIPSTVPPDPYPVMAGLNAGTPFILKAEPMAFSVSFTLAQDITSNFAGIVARTLKEMLRSEHGPGHPDFVGLEEIDGVLAGELTHYSLFDPNSLQRVRRASYEIDHELNGGELIPVPFIGEVIDSPSPQNAYLNKLINPVMKMIGVTPGSNGSNYNSGVIVNKAKPVFKFKRIKENGTPNNLYGEGLDDFTQSSTEFGLNLFLESVSDFDESGYPVDLEFTTCIRSTRRSSDPDYYEAVQDGINSPILSWITLPQEEVFNNSYDGNLTTFFEEVGIGLTPEEVGINSNFYDVFPDNEAYSGLHWRYQVGFVVIDSDSTFHEDNLVYSSEGFYNSNPDLPDGTSVFSLNFLVDGEGGPGGGKSRGGGSGNAYDDLNLDSQGSITCTPQVERVSGFNDIFHWNRGNLFYDNVISVASAEGEVGAATTLPLMQNPFVQTELSYFNVYPDPEENPDQDGVLSPTSVNYKLNHGHAEIIAPDLDVTFEANDSRTTFKTSANHDFGIVYYDERGRHGFVNHLEDIVTPNSSTVYVPGYSAEERGQTFGRQGVTEIDLTLLHDPPEWAHNYKIVYSKNTSVQDFVQYAAGGAFTPMLSQIVSDTDYNIYVSLNYLQGHPISYVSSFGARTPEGGLNLYKYQEGDRLRVVSFESSENGARTYPFAYEFDVVDLVNLGDDTENPLADTPDKNQQGQFVVLRDNPNAGEFNFASVSNNLNNAWGKNCLVEIFTPSKEKDQENQVYYETSETYRVIRNPDGDLTHEENPVTMKNGDVWFRKVAVNFREFQNGSYTDLIYDDDDVDAAKSNFVSLYTETASASDLFRSDNLGLGRPNAVLEGATSVRREATVTYSDPSNPESRKLNYSSFNSSLANFKDLPEVYGDINYLNENGSNLFVLQENKSGMVFVNKNIISDVNGSQSIIASRQVLGEATFYPGKNGCDNNPESVADLGEAVFFANKSLGKIYRFDKSKGVQAISDDGMAATLRKAFKEAMDSTTSGQHVKVVGGYDPIKDEYLMTILPQINDLTSAGVTFADQPVQLPVIGPDEEDESEEDESEEDNNDETALIFEMVQDAIDYINAQSELEDETRHMTGIQFKALIDGIIQKNPSGGKIVFDSFTDGRDGLVGTSDLTRFLASYQQNYNINESVYVDSNIPNSTRTGRLPRIDPFLFKNTQSALDYINSIGTMTVEEFLLLRSFLKNNVCMAANVGSTSVTLPDFLQLLAIYNLTSVPSDTAYGPQYPGATAPANFITVGMAISFIINQQDMTIAQYQVFAEHVKPVCKFDTNEDNVISTADLLSFLGPFLNEEDSWSLQDPAFNF